MIVTIQIPDETVRDILFLASDEVDQLGEPSSFEHTVLGLLGEAVERRQKDVMDDDEVDRTIESMVLHALRNTEPETPFKTNELYASATGSPWAKLDPSVRKSIGRRFKAAIGVHAETAHEGESVIRFDRKNINNAAIYCVAKKEEWELL